VLEINVWCGLLSKKFIRIFFFAETTIARNISHGVVVKFFFTHVGNVHVDFATATSAATRSPRGYLINRLDVRPNHPEIDL
jgi:hypothetical protein